MCLATGNNPINQYWEVTIEYIMHLDRKSLVKKRFISDGQETFFCTTKAENIESAR